MGRKNLLKGLMPQDAEGQDRAEAPVRPARPSRGAIGAVSQSIADLRSRSITEVPADMIDLAGLTDRLDADPEGIEALAHSIATHGQQVPVLVRHHANVEGRYEVVYGRRRVAAMKLLRMPVKVMIRDLNDRELIIAQGQENSARRDLTFIEKANFARQMQEMGYERPVICDALHVDKTVISRMLSVAQAIPPRLVRKIGAAPAIGRDRWLALAARIEGRAEDELLGLIEGDSSDARFEALFRALDATPEPAPARLAQQAPQPLTAADGTTLGEVRQKGGRTVLMLESNGGFDAWLVERMAALHGEWRERMAEKADKGTTSSISN